MSVLKDRLADLVEPIAEDDQLPIDFSRRQARLSAKSIRAGVIVVAVLAVFALLYILLPQLWAPSARMPQVQTTGAVRSSQAIEPPSQSSGASVSNAPPKAHAVPENLTVSVVGLVVRPGVVVVDGKGRVNDAIVAAGGLLPEANPASVLLAAPLVDGQQIVVSDIPLPVTTGLAAGSGGVSDLNPVTGSSAGGDSGSSGGANAAAGAASSSVGTKGQIDINAASATELEELPGVGPATAKKIVDYRTKNGPFNSVEALEEVPGIGPAKVETLRDMATVTTPNSQ